MDKGEVDAFIYIRKGFEQAIKKGDSADVLIVVDGTNSNMASVTLGYVNRIVNDYSRGNPDRKGHASGVAPAGLVGPRLDRSDR